MNITVIQGSTLNGTVGLQDCPPIPGDKSLSHRAALFGALADGESVVENFQNSGVTQAMLKAIGALGIDWKLENNRLVVQGKGLDGLRSPEAALNCGNSATTLRLLAGALAASGIEVVLGGSDGLCRRPMKRIVEPLQQMMVPIQATAEGTAPLRMGARRSGDRLKALDYTLPVASAQVKSCLLLAALASDGPTFLREPELSRDHTERMLASMGVEIESSQQEVDGKLYFATRLAPLIGKTLTPLNLSLPGDFSAAAFLIVAALITPSSKIIIPNVGLNATRTGLLDALIRMGADIFISETGESGGEPTGTLTVQSSNLQSAEISGGLVVRMIDEFPIFAIAAAYASGKTVVRDAAELRYKESDRIGKLCSELVHLGVDIAETEDGFIIDGGKGFMGGEAAPHGDHRLAMSMMVGGLGSSQPVRILGAEVAGESFPDFAGVLKQLGAILKIEG